jgi:hypothetical protein
MTESGVELFSEKRGCVVYECQTASKKSVNIKFKDYSESMYKKRFRRPEMTVSLNRAPLKAIVISKMEYVTIGLVRWGLEYGWLAIAPNGNYLRINGSVEERLDLRDVKAALYRAKNNKKALIYEIM